MDEPGVAAFLCAWFTEELGVPSVMADDSWLALGASSLTLMRATFALEGRVGAELDVVDVFNADTVGSDRRTGDPVQLAAAVSDRLGVPVAVPQLYEHPTVQALARAVAPAIPAG